MWLRGTPQPCCRSIWHTACAPKYSFIVWLATLGRLSTKDRLGLGEGEQTCNICGAAIETNDHLFFQCRVV